MNIISALDSLRPNSGYSLKTDNYDDIEWHDQNTNLPTEEEINLEIVRLRTKYETEQYQRTRAAAYPSWQDQLDNIYHNGIDAWKADIQAIKDNFPKP